MNNHMKNITYYNIQVIHKCALPRLPYIILGNYFSPIFLRKCLMVSILTEILSLDLVCWDARVERVPV